MPGGGGAAHYIAIFDPCKYEHSTVATVTPPPQKAKKKSVDGATDIPQSNCCEGGVGILIQLIDPGRYVTVLLRICNLIVGQPLLLSLCQGVVT